MSLLPDEAFMARALELAREAEAAGEVPVGAVLTAPDGGSFEDRNRTRELSDPTAHAEMLVIRAAAAALGDWRLEGHVLYVTLEPCAMCAGAAVTARLDQIVFGAADPKAGMCGSLADIVRDPGLNHSVDVRSGVLAAECGGILTDFFRARR